MNKKLAEISKKTSFLINTDKKKFVKSLIAETIYELQRI